MIMPMYVYITRDAKSVKEDESASDSDPEKVLTPKEKKHADELIDEKTTESTVN
jgi:hypothetical protein